MTRQRRYAKTVTPAIYKRSGFAWALGVDVLYKFRSFQNESVEWINQILIESKIYFSHPDQLNDPFDIAPTVKHDGNPTDPSYIQELELAEKQFYQQQGYSAENVEALRQRTGVSAENLPTAATQNLRTTIRDAARVLCLSSSQLDPLQWAHYANGHQGVCIHFQCRRGSWLEGARQVRYLRRRPMVRLPLPLSRQDNLEFTRTLALTKAHFWSYENEFRVFANRDRRAAITLYGTFGYFAPSEVTGLTIGMSMKASDRALLREIVDARRQSIPVWECIEDRDCYGFSLRRLDW
jgi:hypothetical protein